MAGSPAERPATALGQAAAHSLIGGRSGDDGKIRSGDLLTGGAVDHHRLDFRAGAQIDQLHRGALGGEVTIAPSQQRQQHRVEIPAAIGQHIFIARRMLVVASALQQARFDQRIQPARQHVRRDAKALLKFVEPGEPVKRVAQDQDRPPLADPVEAAGDRAMHVAKAFAMHG